MESVVVLPKRGEVWRSRTQPDLKVRVLEVDLHCSPPAISYEVLDDSGGSPLTGALRVRLDATWHEFFDRCGH